MAEREELILEVEVDDGNAESKLRGIERAAENVEEAVEETGTAAERAGRQLVELADKTRTEMVQTKAAADALAQALGPELTAKADLDSIVADLQRMGLTLEDIKGEADTLAAALKEADGVRLQGLSQGVDITRRNMDGLRSSSDQSRSVLANLAGNSAQDLGELGGVVGTLGVGLGQLAEYAVDGNISLSNLAKVAGPMLGVAAAGLLISKAIGGIKADQAFNAELVENFADALREGQSAAQALREEVEETGRLELSDDGFFGLGAQIKDVLPYMTMLGLSFDDFQRLVDEALAGGTDSVNAFFDAMEESLGVTERQQSAVDEIRDTVFQYADAIDKARTAQEQLDTFMSDATTSTEDATNAMVEAGQAAREMSADWALVLGDFADDGKINTQIEAWDRLREALGKTDAELAEMAQQKIDEQLQTEAEAAEAAAAAQREHAEALAATNAELANIAGGLDRAQSRAEGLANAFADLNERSELDSFSQYVDIADDLDTLDTAIRDLVRSGVDLNEVDLVPESWEEVRNMPEELRPVVEAFQGLRDSVQTQLAEAFEVGGESGIRVAAQELRDTIIAEFQEMRDKGIISAEEMTAGVNAALSAAGLGQEDIEIAIRLAQADQALATLGLIQGVIDGLPPEVVLKIAAEAATDPVAALQTAIAAFEDAGITVPVQLQVLADELAPEVEAATAGVTVTVPVEADTTPAEEDIAGVVDIDHKTTIETVADTAQAAEDLLTETSRGRTAIIRAAALTQSAATELDALTAGRTVIVDVTTGSVSLPSASQIRSQVTGGQGRITVPIVGVWSTRLEGSRPR